MGANGVEKLVSFGGQDQSPYLHYRPVAQDASGEFVATFFRQHAAAFLGISALCPPTSLAAQDPAPPLPSPRGRARRPAASNVRICPLLQAPVSLT